MGGGKGKGKGKKGKDRKRKNKDRTGGGNEAAGDDPDAKRARNDIWQEDGDWDLSNEAYENYYTQQRICSAEEWPALLQHLRTGLPVAIRVNRMRAGAGSLCDRLAEMQAACAGGSAQELLAPRPLTWYPHSLGWQWLGLERRTIKKDTRHKALKEFLLERERSGMISRQEVVSMIPPLFLDVGPHHLVLDLCAAPGSKTSQMLEFMHWGSFADGASAPTGLVLANELQWKRANMLAHQVQRLGSPCGAVVNMDAQFFPEVWETLEDGSQQPLRYDRVLCDVPCSGDGTMRKTPYIWKSWTLKDGLSLHIRQLGILYRGLELLKVGGRLVYSTCSLNPMEDESVVAAALEKHAGSIVLLPPPDLPGFNAARSLDCWEVPDPNGTVGNTLFFKDYESLPAELREKEKGSCKILPSMFPPKGEGSAEILASVKDNCRRMLPHLMDTGGFFVAIFEKRADLKPSARSRREALSKAIKAKAAAEASATSAGAGEAAPEPDEAAASQGAASSAAAGDAVDASVVAEDKEAEEVAPQPLQAPQGLRRITKEYVQVDDTCFKDIVDFYGFDASMAKRFAMRTEGDKKDKVFLLSEGLGRLLRSDTKMPPRMVLCGVAAFGPASWYHERSSTWAPLQQGLPALVALGMRRRLSGSRQFLSRLLREKDLSIEELRAAAAKGEVQGLDALVDAQGAVEGALRPGSLAVVLLAEPGISQAPFAVLATLTDEMLELSVKNAGDVSSLLEDLEGPPPVTDMLKHGDGKDSDGGEADNETAMDPGPDEAATDGDVDNAQPQKGLVDPQGDASQSGMDTGADADVEPAGEADEMSSEVQA